NNGYAVGDLGNIFRTYNRGINWTQQGINITSNNLYGVSFWQSVRCHVTGSGGIIINTGNGGTTWQIQYLSGEDYYSIIMDNQYNGFAIGSIDKEILESTGNGGTNWINMLYQPGNRLFDGSFVYTSNILVFVGNNGRIRKTVNGGNT